MSTPSHSAFYIPTDVLTNPQTVCIDVRTHEEINTLGAVPDTVHLPLQELPQRFEEIMHYQTVVFFCQSGVRSQYAQEFLQSMGHKAVYNGGGWEEFSCTLKKAKSL